MKNTCTVLWQWSVCSSCTFLGKGTSKNNESVWSNLWSVKLTGICFFDPFFRRLCKYENDILIILNFVKVIILLLASVNCIGFIIRMKWVLKTGEVTYWNNPRATRKIFSAYKFFICLRYENFFVDLLVLFSLILDIDNWSINLAYPPEELWYYF